MKSLSLAVAALALGVPAATSTAAVITLGTPLAAECYRSADSRILDSRGLWSCNRALEGALDAENRSATYVNRGIVRMNRRDFAGAEADFNAALALDPEQTDAWLNKGFLRLRTGDADAAMPFLERALELRPRRPALAYLARGIAHELSGNVRAAYADLTRARDLEPGWDLPGRELSRYQVR
ncbi:MAG: tetratricopeptide repeat protein [Sphingomicrobium sp.]